MGSVTYACSNRSFKLATCKDTHLRQQASCDATLDMFISCCNIKCDNIIHIRRGSAIARSLGEGNCET